MPRDRVGAGAVLAELGTLTSDKNYDVFAYWTGSAVAIELLAWTDDSTRATALTTQDGVFCKTGATDRRYVGTIRTTATTTTEDSAAKRFIYNGPEPWRQVLRCHVAPAETADSWSYATATWRQANANTANKVETVVGLPTMADAVVVGSAFAGSSGGGAFGIGIDATNANSAQNRSAVGSFSSANYTMPANARYVGVLAAGYHTINWLEIGNATAFSGVGDNTSGSGTGSAQNGLTALVPG